MPPKFFGTLAALVFLAGCAGNRAILTITGPKQPSRGDHCEFEMLTQRPAVGYEELATVDVETDNYVNPFKSNLADFRAQIESRVCEAGGDAALAEPNGYGVYVKATVLKATGAPPPPPAAAPPPPPAAEPAIAPAPSPPPPAGAPPTAGCQFDGQCKSDRICVKGECVDPAKK